MPTFSRDEVRMHNRHKDSWYILFNSVYDLSAFLDEHPGGMEFLSSRAGTDITSFFLAKHAHNRTVHERLRKYRIGELPENEYVDPNAFDEPFFSELLSRCEEGGLFDVPKWHSNPWFFVRSLNIFAFFGLSFSVLYTDIHWTTAVVASVLQAAVSTSLFGLLAHESAHRDFPANTAFRFLLKLFWPIFWPFILREPLIYEHNNHHVKIGDPEYDYEVAGFAEVIRYSGQIALKNRHRVQHRLAALAYPFYANIITTIGGVRSGYWQQHNRPIGNKQFVSLAATILYFVVIPVSFGQSVWWCFLFYAIYQCVLYTGIYVGAAINHFIPAATDAIPTEHQNRFGYYVCHHTSNFSLFNPFMFWYTGGFNVQIEHHLMPFIPVENLNRMTVVVKDLCKEHGYPYNEYPNLAALWKEHYAFLKVMGSEAVNESVQNEVKNKRNYQAR